MTVVLREYIGRFVHVYLDDIFVFSNMLEEHERHLRLVLDALTKAEFYLEHDKCDLYTVRLDCLGHMIDTRGVHADTDKMARIREWRTPRNLTKIQRFIGLIEYLAQFMPDVSAYTTPLTSIQRNGHTFLWREIHDRCFQVIKDLACKYPILRPINPASSEPIWLICDVSLYGVDTLYSQGEDWKTCRPAGFMSKKLTNAQHNYRTFEQETLAILEALLKWEDKLLRFPFKIITNHKALTYLSTQQKLSSRQIRWTDYLSRFNAEIVYMKGVDNKVADCLSQYYETEGSKGAHERVDWANADIRLNPEGDDLPQDRLRELQLASMRASQGEVWRSTRLHGKQEERCVKAAEMCKHAEPCRERTPLVTTSGDPTLLESAGQSPAIRTYFQKHHGFMEAVRMGYKDDPILAKVVETPKHHPMFSVDHGLIHARNSGGEKVLCVPRTRWKGNTMTTHIIDHAHKVLGHLGALRTADYVHRWYWWPGLGKEVD